MAAEAATMNPATQQVDEEKVLVGTFSFSTTPEDLKAINDKIGDVLEAQVILRGSKSLGYGFVKFNKAGAATDAGEISGDAKLLRGRGAKGGRGRAGKKTGGRVRRSADDPAGEDATAEESAQNGNTSVKAVTDGVEKLTIAEGGEGKGARGKGKKAKGAARPPREKKERGEPSKTLVFIRNLPYSITEEGLGELFTENGLTYKSLSLPAWKYGPHKGKGRGYAFANVENEAAQQLVIEALNGKELSAGEAKHVTDADKAAGEGAPIETERKLVIVARQGYENEESTEKEGQNGTAGPEDSGTAEQTA